MTLYTFIGVLLVLHNQFGNTLSSTTTEEYTTMESTTEEYTTMESTTMESTSSPSTTTEPPTSTEGITQTTLGTTTTDTPSTTTHSTLTTTEISSTMASGTETTSVPLTTTITVPDSTTSTSVSTTATTLYNEITTSSETTTSQTPPTSLDTTTTSGMASDTTTTTGMTSDTTTAVSITTTSTSTTSSETTTSQTPPTSSDTTTTSGMASDTTTTAGMTSDTTTAVSITTTSTPAAMTTTMGTSTDLSVTTSSVASENSQTTTTGDNQTTTAAPTSTSEISSTTISITSSDNPTTTQLDSTTITIEGDNQTTAVTSSASTTSDVSTSSTPPDTTTDSVGVPSNVTVSPSVAAVLGMSMDNTSQEPHMVCVFADPGGMLFFLVKWYINNNLLTTTNYGAVTYNNVNTTAALRPNHWTSNYSMNMNVNCSVSAQYLVDSGQGPESRSPSFFAGVTISESTLSINEGETTQITLTSSVPVGCSASLTDAEKETQCKANLHIITSEWSWCWNGVKYLSTAFPDNGCHVSIPYKYWDQAVILNVTGYVDAVKNWWGRYSSIKFKSTTNPSDASNTWNNMNIDHTVSVTVWDTSSYTSGGGICGGYNDPHMVTFDRRYWENQRVGEFVMYQHKTKPLAVHALYSTCYPWRAACNCGVAIRSGQNLYVVRTCIEVSQQNINLLSYPYERYDGCSQEDEITVEKMGTNYRVTLPSGTEVSFSFSTYSHWINFIQIVASSTDLHNTEGICGSYDNDNTNDFVPKNNASHTPDERAFALSWRVEIGSTDSLFKKNPDVIYGSSSGGSTQQTTERYCTCSSFYNYNDQYNVPFDANYAKCNLEAPTEPCSDRSGQTVNVCSLSRRRRSTNSDDIMDEIEFSYDPNFNVSAEFEVAEWPSGNWTEVNATIFCNRSFTEDIAVTTCIEKVNTSAAEYIASCVEDIKMVGNSDFIQATLDTLKKECITTASRDSSFSNSTTDGGGSILDLLRSLVCPNNCSGQGVCVNETCDCNTNFIGEDCSVELSQPPGNISIPQQGACDTSVRACQKTNIVGTFYSETIYAKCTYFKGTSTGKVSSNHEVLADVQYRHINLITVTIPSPPSARRRRRSAGSDAHGWNITLSYDNTTFGDAAVILLFDSTTKTCDTTTFICISKVAVAETESDNNAGIIAGAVVGSVVVIAVIVGIIIYITKYKKIKGRVSSSEVDLGNPKDSVPLTRPSL